MERLLSKGFLVFALATVAGSALAANPHFLGTTKADVPSAHAVSRPADVAATAAPPPTFVFKSAQYASGGVALRNRGIGVIHVSGAIAPIQSGYLYFADLYSGTAPSTAVLKVKYLASTATPTYTLTAKLIATGGDPCWNSSGIAVYRVVLGAALRNNGNGAYEVTLDSTETALTTGEDPWDGNVQYPLAEGASIVLVGTGGATVGIYDSAIPSATTLVGSSYSYTLRLPAAAPANQTLFDSIGADGQLGDSRFADIDNLDTINGSPLAGGNGSSNPNSDFTGSSGFPLPQLWDDTGHDITSLVPSGATTMSVSINAATDCVSTIANIVSLQ